MIVTIKTPNPRAQLKGMFEAMKYGLEAEKYVDNSFDLVVHDLTKAEYIANYCGGKIKTIVDQLQYPVYE
jgi:hypothetical protein